MGHNQQPAETTAETALRAAARRTLTRGRTKARRTAAELWAPCFEQLDLFGETTADTAVDDT